ncbi:hypothetical protein [Micromonospora sp. WMMD736]|uniref:hypothetical protein n=1 Tax=Micromonospora sp. WMMD736 TaxID=3404112 RepID=UPI003B94324F
MGKRITQVAVSVLVAAGGLAAAAAPAQAGGYITEGFYYSLASCESTGKSKVASGYQSYYCLAGYSGSRPIAASDVVVSASTDAAECDRCGSRGFWLRLYIS